MYVWVIVDEKYGPQAIFRTKAAADKALANDHLAVFCPSGYPPAPVKMKVRD